MDRSEKIKQLQETIHELEKELKKLFTEIDESNFPPQPLCMNRRKDYEEWKKECEEYKIDYKSI